MYSILGDTIIAFMKEKPTPYLKGALLSKVRESTGFLFLLYSPYVCDNQDHFWRVPVFKRALTFVFLVRYVLGYKSQQQWKKFTCDDYKLNQRCFKRWSTHEANIFSLSAEYLKLTDRIVKPSPAKEKEIGFHHWNGVPLEESIRDSVRLHRFRVKITLLYSNLNYIRVILFDIDVNSVRHRCH